MPANKNPAKPQENKVPNPGSDAALNQGCTCPVLDNGHGNEELGRWRGFWITAGCPLHSVKLSSD